ncbi:hypothetical protein F2P81_006050 [Scophthalmus maximus]|uniref:Uncharacterized protein n=1 Tax=Scophthalmus maximus TaxID=52904 RepID=A0A6A4TDN6_SCOMX|nr:hypothetical protein F2P81_006050 [Scophthalmus maximus]
MKRARGLTVEASLLFMIDEKASLDKQLLDKLIWKMSRLDLCKHFGDVINLRRCQTKNRSLTELRRRYALLRLAP